METAELLEIIKQLGLEQQNIWSLLPEAGEAGAGLQKHRGGWSLKEGGTILYFSDSPVPGLSGFADGANRCVWADSNYKWSIEYAEGENPQPTRSTSVIRPEKSGLEFVDKGGGFWEIKVTWETALPHQKSYRK